MSKARATPVDAPVDIVFQELEHDLRGHLPPGRETEALVAGLRAFVNLRGTPAGRVLLAAIEPKNAPRIDQFKDSRNRSRYWLRVANTFEFGPASFHRALIREASMIPEAEEDELRYATSRAPSRRLAETIRKGLSDEPAGSLKALAAEVGRQVLSPKERAGFIRAIKVGTSGLDFAALLSERERGEFSLAANLAVRSAAAGPLAFIPPPEGENYGTKNRSPILISTDRKRCRWPGCAHRVKNAAHFCVQHRRQAAKDKREAKLRRRKLAVEARALSKAAARASALPNDVSPSVDGELPNTLVVSENLRTLRRRLQER
jgi:hypothetical protein